jgi:hypothetical protein
MLDHKYHDPTFSPVDHDDWAALVLEVLNKLLVESDSDSVEKVRGGARNSNNQSQS